MGEEDWRTCRYCGTKHGEESSNYVISGCCRKCRTEKEDKADFEYAQTDGYIRRDDSIMCPYCGYVDDETGEMHNITTYDCPECEKESELSVEYTSHFTTTKK